MKKFKKIFFREDLPSAGLKILRIMKLTFFLLLMSVVSVLAEKSYSQAKKLNLTRENATIKEVLSAIEDQSEFYFMYSEKVIDVNRRVTVNIENQTVETVLKNLFAGTDVEYTLKDRIIVLTTPEVLGGASLSELQQKSVSGKVIDSSGQFLPGVTVLVKGTTLGTVTNADGAYTLGNVPDNATLVFSFIGMRTQEIIVQGKVAIDVVLQEETIGIEEVVAIAFGIKRTQRELTYSTYQLEGDDLTKAKNPNLLSSLQGKVAGVTVNLQSGMVGRTPQIRIRGNRSLRDNNPLYVIDGVPVPGLTDFDPNNIESINILKGPAASALYGLQASNGVIIITSKSGRGFEGKPTITYENHFGIEEIGYFAPLQYVYAQGTGGKVFDQNSPWVWGPKISDLQPYTNLLGEMEQPASYKNDRAFYKTGNTISNNLSLRNAGDFGNYIISLGNYNQAGVVEGTKANRTSMMLGGEYVVSKDFKLGAYLNYVEQFSRDHPDEGGNDNYIRGLRDTPPSYNLAGKPFADPNNPAIQVYWRGAQNNPYWLIRNQHRDIWTARSFGHIFLSYSFFKDISVNYRVGFNKYTRENEYYRNMGKAPAWRQIPPIGGSITISNNSVSTLNSNLYFEYEKTFFESLKLNSIIGNEFMDTNSRTANASGTDFVVQGWNNLDNTTKRNSSNSISSARTMGIYGNINLGWDNTYFINASGRNDIVSNMLRGNRSFFYPSIGGSIVLSEALSFLPKQLNYAQIRATYAEVGQVGPRNVNYAGFVASSPGFQFPYAGISAYTIQGQRINPNLRPENTKSFEVGADLRFFDNRINLNYAYYSTVSEDQIFSVPLAPSTGYTSELQNSGSIESSGHEIALSIIPVRTKSFSWEFNTNFTKWKSILAELAPGIERITFSAEIVGEVGHSFPSIIGRGQYIDPISGERVFHYQTGLPLLDQSYRIIGSPVPDFEMNFQNSITYKGLSLTVQLDWRSGSQFWSVSNNEAHVRGTAAGTLDREVQQEPFGKKGFIQNGKLEVVGDNDIPFYKNYDYYQALGAWNISAEQLQDGSFLRLREVSLNYNIPTKILLKTFIESASLVVTGRNLFLITESFYDPEVNQHDSSSDMLMGSELSQVPNLRSFGVGLKINF